MPKTASSILKPIECDVCKEHFTSKQYLRTHMFWKHPAPSSHGGQHEIEIITEHDEEKPSAKSVAVVLTDSETEVTEEVTEEDRRGRSSVRRGSCKRRSYTLDFKVKTLRLLDRRSMTKNLKNKWEKVASMRGISNKSLVVKWNKDRKKRLDVYLTTQSRKELGISRLQGNEETFHQKRRSKKSFHLLPRLLLLNLSREGRRDLR